MPCKNLQVLRLSHDVKLPVRLDHGEAAMITIGGRSDLAQHLINAMYEFRYETFVRRLRWSLPLLDGVERDQYDNERATYFIARDISGAVTACARLLPTTAPYMLPEIFAELLGGKPPPCDPAIWELSRFATNVRKSGDGRVLSFSKQTLDLLKAVMEFGQQKGIKKLLLVTSIAIERLLLRTNFSVHRMAPPVRMEDGIYAAIFLDISTVLGAVMADSDCSTAGSVGCCSVAVSGDPRSRLHSSNRLAEAV